MWSSVSVLFRRCLKDRLIRLLEDVLQLARFVCFTSEDDSIVSHFSSDGVYS